MAYLPSFQQKPAFKCTATFVDAEGETGQTDFYISTGNTTPKPDDLESVAEVIALAMQAVSHALLLKLTIADELTYDLSLPAGVVGATDDIEDKAYLQLKAANGRAASFQVPAPQANSFLGDDETVNPADASVAALVTALTTPVTVNSVTYTPSTVSGDPLVIYIKGERTRKKTRRNQRGGIATEIGG